MNRPLIFIDTNNAPVFCNNRCNNKECSKHQTKAYQHTGVCKLKHLRDTEDCEGYISKWKQSHAEIEQIKQEMREAGIE